MSIEPIRAVVFDAVGTLMYPQPSVADAYRVALKEFCGVDCDETTVQSAVKEAMAQRSTGQDFVTSEDAERTFWADLVHSLCGNADGADACFEHLFQHFAAAKNWICFEDVAGAISRLRQTNLQLAIASNFDRRLNSVCDGLPELADISTRVISSEVGFRKPSAEFFAAVAAQLQLPPSQILMIGDDATNDVQGALNAGFRALWLTRRSPSRPEIASELAQRSDAGVIPVLDCLDGPFVARFATDGWAE